MSIACSGIETYRTSRLTLRPLAPADQKVFVSLFQLPEVVAHRPNPTPDPIDVITTAFADDLVRWHLHGHGRWAIEATGHVIGFGGVLPKSGFTGLNVSYHLLPDSWGRGYASEFLNAALAMAFGPLAASRVIGLVRQR